MSKKILSILLSLVIVLGIFAAVPFTASAATVVKTVHNNNHTYELFSGRTSWKEAKEACESRGGYLAVVNSAEENSYLASMASGIVYSAWLGGSDEDSEGEWYWVNGDDFTYTNWTTGEPNNVNEVEHYLQFSGGTWNDIDNNTTSNGGFFCEYDYLKKVEPTSTTVYNNHKYELYEMRITWTEAKAECEAIGGHLATISSAEENKVLYDLTDGLNNGVWIGGTDEGSEGNWRWITDEDFTYTNWSENDQPDNNGGNENYLEFRYEGRENGVWNDRRNGDSVMLGFICEYENSDLEPAKTTEYNNHKYELYTEKTTWKSAKAICEERGGYLAAVNSAKENEVLTALADGSGAGVWLGGSDEGSEGNWYWVNGDEFSYSNWAEGEPNNGNGIEHFISLICTNDIRRGQYNDTVNYDRYTTGFICEYDSIASAILGDVDGDEEVGVIDATYIQRYDAGFNIPIAEEDIIARGDIDGDGEVGVIDATYIQRYDAGFNTPYPIGEPV